MKTLPIEAWAPTLRRVIDDMDGRPLEVHALMANHPALLDAWWNYRLYVVQGGELAQRDCELAILRVAHRTNCWYEWASHVDRGLTAGLTLNEIERVRLDSLNGWSEADATLLDAVDELVSRHGLSAASRDLLAKHCSEQQILDLISVCGTYLTLAMMLNTWEVPLDEHIADRLPDEVTRQDFDTR